MAIQYRREFSRAGTGRIMLRTLNLDGDRQADPSVHGGPSKAVYAISQDYQYWKRELPEMKLPWVMFGENFTTAGTVGIRAEHW